MRIFLDPSSKIGVVEQIYTQLRLHIVAGHFRPGEILPSIREITDGLKVSSRTVQLAYGQLSEDGLCEGDRASATLALDPPREVIVATALGLVDGGMDLRDAANVCRLTDPEIKDVVTHQTARAAGDMLKLGWAASALGLTRSDLKDVISKAVTELSAEMVERGQERRQAVVSMTLPTGRERRRIARRDADGKRAAG